MNPDLPFLAAYAVFWFIVGILIGIYVIPWVVDRWRD